MRPALELGDADGLRVRLLPDRALDCGAAWFASVPIAWLSGLGEPPPLDSLSGEDFRRRRSADVWDRLHQWTHPGLGALGVEPANCSVLDRAGGRCRCSSRASRGKRILT